MSEPVWVVIDLETTGGSPHAGAHIIEFGAALVVGKSVRQRVNTLVRPPRMRDLHTRAAGFAQRVHGIRPAQVWSEGMEAGAAAARVKAWLRGVVARHGPVSLTSYNLPFERRFLDLAPWSFQQLDEVVYGPCVLAMARSALPELPSYRLARVAARLGLFAEESHRAEADADLAARVLLAISG